MIHVEQVALTEMSNESFYMDSFSSNHQIDQKLLQIANFGSLDDLYLYVVSPPFQSFRNEIINLSDSASQDSDLIESNKKRPCVFPLANSSQKLSTETIIRLAAEKFIQSTLSGSELRMLRRPYPSAFLDKSSEDSRAVELVQTMLSCVEKVSEKQYGRASRILLHELDCTARLSEEVDGIDQRPQSLCCDCVKLKHRLIKETGRHLSSFAQSLNIQFSFNALLVYDILDLNEELFDLD
ncbi:unnamed protein product [Fraxinus pennsylvanica]|uniref:Uncharacterized protein n=1 Tax=Fraxinus pennsylvanica TaxID=56036 RepID=A0AAD2DTR2_9LAMI|nr:unnamed protein product [Fraxinus pennsylvanica]